MNLLLNLVFFERLNQSGAKSKNMGPPFGALFREWTGLKSCQTLCKDGSAKNLHTFCSEFWLFEDVHALDNGGIVEPEISSNFSRFLTKRHLEKKNLWHQKCFGYGIKDLKKICFVYKIYFLRSIKWLNAHF